MEILLPFALQIGLALLVLLITSLLAVPVRARFARSELGDRGPRTWGRFFTAVLAHLPFAAFALTFSALTVLALNHYLPPRPGSFEFAKYHAAWLTYWGLYLLVRLGESLLVESWVQFGGTCPFSKLTRDLLRCTLMLAIAAFLIKNQLGHNITVLLTSTAIVTGVIGFAMQGVLGNLLAGMSLHATRTVNVGDWIELENGTIGQAILVNWRETRLRTRGGHVVILPNAKLAEQTVRNLSSPDADRRHRIVVGASYGDVPGEVITALVESAAAVPAVFKEPQPYAVITGYKDFCIEYELKFWSNQYERRDLVEGDVMRMIWYQFNRRGIEIPFPMSGRMLSQFMDAVHAQQTERPLPAELEKTLDALLASDFGGKLLADATGECLLRRDELRPLARQLRHVRYTAGETLFRQGDSSEAFYILLHGELRGEIANPETGLPVQFTLAPGALFGEMSLLTGLPRTATITATAECELIECDRDAFTRLLALREEIPQRLSELAANRAQQNAAALEKLRASLPAPPDLGRDGIFRRLKRMLRAR